jgi:hypothetical protein
VAKTTYTPHCDEVQVVEPRMIPTVAGLDTASDADNASAQTQVVANHFRQSCVVHCVVPMNSAEMMQEWLDSNKKMCPGCRQWRLE